MIRYELCYWPEKNDRAIFRYQNSTGEHEITERSLAKSLLVSVRVTDDEIDAEIDRIRKLIDETVTDKSERSKRFSELCTKKFRKRVDAAVRERRRDATARVVAAEKIQVIRQRITEACESIIAELEL